MKKSILVILLMLPILGFAQTGDFNISQIYPIERSHSYVGFTVEYMGYARVRGRFESFNGSFRYDENDISNLIDLMYEFLIHLKSGHDFSYLK